MVTPDVRSAAAALVALCLLELLPGCVVAREAEQPALNITGPDGCTISVHGYGSLLSRELDHIIALERCEPVDEEALDWWREAAGRAQEALAGSVQGQANPDDEPPGTRTETGHFP